MMAKAKEPSPVATVLLVAFGASQNKILDISLPVDDYYCDSHPIIDDNEFRKKMGIRYIEGQIFDYEGNLDQKFKNEYDSEGAYKHSKIVHSDGTIIED
ncbi:hypothetical protein [uncultured Gimesia sp.]|jgi:hypothetical protein|uniref:hypothetical protein n=1 Tax=uncultured Gimesia sp. TaxID=1678688 RepID=UPI002618CDF9|nr:hypothetical protein [uncultured Gimesia sp.]